MTITYEKHFVLCSLLQVFYSLFFWLSSIFSYLYTYYQQYLPQVIPLRTIGAIGQYLIFLSPRTKLLKQKLWIQGERPNLLLLVSLIPSGPATLFFHEVAMRKEVSCPLQLLKILVLYAWITWSFQQIQRSLTNCCGTGS